MYSSWQLAQKYVSYYVSASNGKGHGIHSPFVYDFVRHVLNDKREFYAYKQVEGLRGKLLRNQNVIEVEDFGAGSTLHKTRLRPISGIAQHAAKSKKWAQLLFRIVNHYQPRNILELGTSLGISTAYMSLANPQARIITAEGSAAIAEQANHNFRVLNCHNIEQVVGNFDDTLPGILERVPQFDLAFVDGNHRLEPTLKYFEQLLPAMHDGSVMVFDDIHWSEGMEDAWHTIQQHGMVKLTIDLFFIGLVFFSDQFKIKQHFSIRF